MHWPIWTLLAFLVWSGSAAAQSGDAKEIAATILNLNGFLCATVTDIRTLTLENQFEVTCIEYRGGSGKVRYILNGKTGTAFKAD
jgi:hypothetical protein